MTARDLKNALDNLDEEDLDKLIYYTYNYGDHWRTIVAGSITLVELGNVEWSDYHSMMKVVPIEEEYDPEDEPNPNAILLG